MRDDHPGETDWLADAMPEPLKLIQPSERPWGRSARRAVQGKRKKGKRNDEPTHGWQIIYGFASPSSDDARSESNDK